ncbi:MAG TPA: A/G-specific adenine glycosylase [Candidatus Dorea intestinavium]|nr:A/G-specific adenine glycosylase [Candidatus Dorea intestinavium]
MKYKNIVKGRFLTRENRFIAYVEIRGKRERVHVKNTGRCRELLIPGATVYLEENNKKERSTKWDLVTVKKGNRLVNMDSQAPNKVVQEWLEAGGLKTNLTKIRPEYTYGDSRLDFYLEDGEKKILLEVKGVTLEVDNVVLFPDAPSERAVKHVHELIKAKQEGYQSYVVLVVQMDQVDYFTPNERMHPEFAKALKAAKKAGVEIKALTCQVTRDSLTINGEIPVILEGRLAETTTPVIKWFKEHKRTMPWREDPTPYHVWLSEIMLQQTRVETVFSYYQRFLEAVPDIAALSKTSTDKLNKLWEGLGYYNRVANMKKAAILIMEEYQGVFPSDYQEIEKLPGIGSYTAGAISSIAFHKPKPAVDGNVLRVITRLLMLEDDIAKAKTKKEIEKRLQEIIPRDEASNYNQGLIEIGALVCIPNGAPKCDLCPLQKLCLSYQNNAWADYPKKTGKMKQKQEDKTILVIKNKDQVALLKRREEGLLKGLYELPNFPGHLEKEQVVKALNDLGVPVLHIEELGKAKHVFSHRIWQMIGYRVKVDELAKIENKEMLFVSQEELEEKYSIPSAFRAYLKQI